MVGIDESGRGCVGGSLFVAAVKDLPEDWKQIVMDSKKLSKKKIFELGEKLENDNRFKSIVLSFNAKYIDDNGLSNTLKTALEEITNFFDDNVFIYDGNCNYGVDLIQTLVKGDSKIPEISAASILAKYNKELENIEIEKENPNFKFTKHSGYVTKKHKEEIRENGLQDFHRKTYDIHL